MIKKITIVTEKGMIEYKSDNNTTMSEDCYFICGVSFSCYTIYGKDFKT